MGRDTRTTKQILEKAYHDLEIPHRLAKRLELANGALRHVQHFSSQCGETLSLSSSFSCIVVSHQQADNSRDQNSLAGITTKRWLQAPAVAQLLAAMRQPVGKTPPLSIYELLPGPHHFEHLIFRTRECACSMFRNRDQSLSSRDDSAFWTSCRPPHSDIPPARLMSCSAQCGAPIDAAFPHETLLDTSFQSRQLTSPRSGKQEIFHSAGECREKGRQRALGPRDGRHHTT